MMDKQKISSIAIGHLERINDRDFSDGMIKIASSLAAMVIYLGYEDVGVAVDAAIHRLSELDGKTTEGARNE